MNLGWLKPPAAPWKKGPLITEDGNCVSHVYWRSGALTDSKGVAWTMNGTVPQVAASGKIPPGAGVFATINNYKTTLVADVFDFTGDFSVAVVITIPQAANGFGTAMLVGNGVGTLWGGFTLGFYDDGSRHLVFATQDAVGAATSTIINQAMPGSYHILCGGRSGTDQISKMNLGTATTTPNAKNAHNATTSTVLGVEANYGGNAFGVAGSAMLEVYATTTAPTDVLFTALANAVKSKLGISAW